MTEDVDPNAIHESLAELERRSVRLRAVAVAVLFVLLLVSLLSLAFTIATAIRTANIIERASAAETGGASDGRSDRSVAHEPRTRRRHLDAKSAAGRDTDTVVRSRCDAGVARSSAACFSDTVECAATFAHSDTDVRLAVLRLTDDRKDTQ